MRKLSEIKRAARALTSKQMMKLDAWLHELRSQKSLTAPGASVRCLKSARRSPRRLTARGHPLREEELPLCRGRTARPLLVCVLDREWKTQITVHREEAAEGSESTDGIG